MSWLQASGGMAVPLAGLPAEGRRGSVCYPFDGYVFDCALPPVRGKLWPRLSAVRDASGGLLDLEARKYESAAAVCKCLQSVCKCLQIFSRLAGS